MSPEVEVVSSPGVNWSSFLSQVHRDYETEPAKGIAHGLQKDAIQNGWGARTSEKGKGWTFTFRLLQSGETVFLTLTDEGTTGLIGDVVVDAKDYPKEFPPSQKLARFESMFDSGGNIGAGLFGRGKLIFNAASKDHLIYYDTFTIDGKYRFGKRHIKGRDCEQFRRVYEGDQAKDQLLRQTLETVEPLTRPGTRVMIVNPLDEVVNAVRDGRLIDAIEETWWELVLKHEATIIVNAYGKEQRAHIPSAFGGLPQRTKGKWRAYLVENKDVEVSGQKARIKRIHLVLPPSDEATPADLRGVSIHRRGMKVGALPISGIPEEISERFFGYVWLDDDFEELIAETENTTHYGFAGYHKAAYKALKRTVQDHVDEFMRQLGYKKEAHDPNEQAKRLMEDVQAELNSILKDLDVPGFGGGSERPSGIYLSVEDLEFPDDSNHMETGDRLGGFHFRVENATLERRTVWLDVVTHERAIGEIERLVDRREMSVAPRKTASTDDLEIYFKKGVYPAGKKIGCTARLTDEFGKLITKKTFFVYLDVLPPEEAKSLADISLESADWPRPSSRRVDYGQSIRILEYRVENLTSRKMKTRVKVRTLWAAEKTEIDSVLDTDVELSAFQDKTISLPEVKVTQEKYQEVNRGKILLRCHAIATEATKLWPKATRLAEHNLAFWLNMDPSYGFFEDVVLTDLGPSSPRSQAVRKMGTRSWSLEINITHPAYVDAKRDEERQENYLFEEAARQTVYVLLHQGQVDVLRRLADLDQQGDLDSLGHEDVIRDIVYRVTDRIVGEYYKG